MREQGTDPLSRSAKRAILALVVFFHVGAGYALTLIHPEPLVIGDTAMSVSFITEAPVAVAPQPEPPPPEETPPDAPQLESMIEPPPPDLPPPAFPVPPPPPPKPVAKPVPPKPPVQQQATPQPSAPAPTAAAPPTGPRTISASQVAYLSNPAPAYPPRALRAGQQGRVLVFVVIDTAGRPAQVSVSQSSGHALLDEAAVSAVRGWRFRPQTENGMPLAVQVTIPVDFRIQ